MSALAVLLLAVGVADLLAERRWVAARWRPLAAVGTGLLLIAAASALATLTTPADVALLTLAGVTVAAWVLSAERGGRGRGQGAALAVLGVGVGALLLLAGWASPADGAFGRWLAWSALPVLQAADPTRVLLLAGLFAVQLSTANRVVRLVLSRVGSIRPAGQPQAADRLKGGRLLGPMERVFILGLGLAGEVTSASLVIAAKGLIRWPELQRSRRARRQGEPDGVGIDAVTEYFLIGSFLSWLMALGALALAALG